MSALALSLLHFLWVTAHLEPAIMSPDANGYVVQARLLADEGRTSFATDSPVQYVGIHWLETAEGTFHSRYPAGLPLIMAAAWTVGGLNAALLVNPLLASVTLFLVFLLARRVVAEPYALLAALVLAVVPTANQHALDADAHIAATFFLVGGVVALLRFADTGARGTSLLAGVLLGAIPGIRYPEAIVGLAIGGWLCWRIRPVWRVWPAALGAALPLTALLAHNASAYGAFWRTGYALTNEQTGFGFGYFASHLLPYLQALSGQGLALMFAFGVAGLAAMVAEPRRRSEGVLFAGITAPLVLLYMAYYFGGGPGGAGGSLRFLLPTFPFFAIAAVWLLARLAENLGQAGRAAVAAVVVLQGVIGIGTSAQVLAQAKTSLGAAARARAMAEREIPAGSVVIVDRQLAESLDATGRWKLVEENMVAGGLAGGPAGPGFGLPVGPVGGRGGPGMRGTGGRPRSGSAVPGEPAARDATPSPMQRDKNRAQQLRYAGLGPEERRSRAWADLAAWAEGRPVYWFARSLDAVDNTLPAGADYRSIAEVDAPVMLGPGGGGGPGGAPSAGPPGRGAVAGPGRAPGGGPSLGGPALGGVPGGRRGGALPATKLRVVRVELPQMARP